MNKKIFIVVGLGYGDEGKGLATDFLCINSVRPLVVRYNGGHQAGHTVVTQAGVRHMFSNFGSGTFRGAPTYWSRNCTFSPSYLLCELEQLPVTPKLLLDKFCPITTHYDVLFNRALESSRGVGRLGSCGAGYGATMDRHQFLQFFAFDLTSPKKIREKLYSIKRYYRYKIEAETKFSFQQFDHDSEDKIFENYIEQLNELVAKRIIEFTEEYSIFQTKEWQTFLFEGAQGILLDHNYGNKPYVTKSNTTTQNAIELLDRNKVKELPNAEVVYVTRCYLTRHGGGPFKEFAQDYKIDAENETNVYNEFQGEFKRGPLSIELLNYAFDCDNRYSGGLKKNVIITCLDQIPSEQILFLLKDELKGIHYTQFPKLLNNEFCKTFFSFNPTSEGMERQKGNF